VAAAGSSVEEGAQRLSRDPAAGASVSWRSQSDLLDQRRHPRIPRIVSGRRPPLSPVHELCHW